VIGPDEFRDAMALLAAPVTVVTTVDAEGHRWGFTASAVMSVSLDPPLVLVGVTRGSSCHGPLTAAGEFVINVLGADHGELARRFAGRVTERFVGGEFAEWPGSSLPVLPGAAVLLRCTVAQIVPAGDHDLLLGSPVDVRTDGSSGALLWYQRGFHVPVHTSAQRKAVVRAA
jgi:flavin reductase ActVB